MELYLYLFLLPLHSAGLDSRRLFYNEFVYDQFYSVDITVSGQLLLSLLFKKVFEQSLEFIYQSRMKLMELTMLNMGSVAIIINDSFPSI